MMYRRCSIPPLLSTRHFRIIRIWRRGSWDQITNASQITNPLAWLEVKDDDSNAHINTHLKLDFLT